MNNVLKIENSKLNNYDILKLGNLITLLSRPGVGKTTFSQQLIAGVVRNNDVDVMLFSIEESKETVEKNMQELCESKNMTNVIIDDKASPELEYIVAQIKKYASIKKLKLVVIDYLQLILENKNNKSLETLKNLAKELDICILVLSQLSQNALSEEKMPVVENLNIDSDTVLLLYNDNSDKKLIIKNDKSENAIISLNSK